jgi:hypothetical protein
VAFTPYDAGRRTVERAQALLQASADIDDIPVRIDMRRLSLVMAVAALDTYMHRLIVDRAYTHRALPGGLAKLDVPFEWLLAKADMAARAARAPSHRSRPRVAVKRQLRNQLLRKTFQRYEEVSEALGMVGRRRRWDEIGQAFNPALTRPEIRDRLNAIVQRRNQIVHEGDYMRVERPRTGRRNKLTAPQARRDVNFISDLIDAIHAVI